MKIESTNNLARAAVAVMVACAILVLLWAVSVQADTSLTASDVQSPELEQSSDDDPAVDTIVVSTTYTIYFPGVVVGYDEPVLSTTDSSQGNGAYVWTLSWTQSENAAGLQYIIEESHSEDFGSIINTYTTTDTSYQITKDASADNVYYYRVRINNPTAPNSNVVSVIGAYYNDFNSGIDGWNIVKQDFDNTDNVLDHEANNYMELHVRGRWDFMMASDLSPAPEPPYRITTRVKFAGPGNLNTYGIIFSGDWDGVACPTYDIGVGTNSSCFNKYYRNILLWNWGGPTMQSEIKAIEAHSADKNSGYGRTIFDWTLVDVSSGSANDWNTWSWEVYPDGTIRIIVNGDARVIAQDPLFEHRPYWAFWASTDEYPGSDPLIDYVLVEPID